MSRNSKKPHPGNELPNDMSPWGNDSPNLIESRLKAVGAGGGRKVKDNKEATGADLFKFFLLVFAVIMVVGLVITALK